MNHRLIIRPEAELDIDESFNWYEDQVSNLGHEFRNSVGAAILRIRSTPHMFPLVYRQIRRALVKRFPHALYYFVANEVVFITACVHQRRDPNVWRLRR